MYQYPGLICAISKDIPQELLNSGLVTNTFTEDTTIMVDDDIITPFVEQKVGPTQGVLFVNRSMLNTVVAAIENMFNSMKIGVDTKDAVNELINKLTNKEKKHG